jgi:hypothetical protein
MGQQTHRESPRAHWLKTAAFAGALSAVATAAWSQAVADPPTDPYVCCYSGMMCVEVSGSTCPQYYSPGPCPCRDPG